MIYLCWKAFLIPTALVQTCISHGNLIGRKQFICASCQKDPQYQEYYLLCFSCLLLFILICQVAYSCFQEFMFWTKKTVLARIPEDFFFFLFFSRGIFHRNVVLEVVAGIPVSCRCHSNFLQEFVWDRNSCIYSGFLRTPPDSSGFRRIPVPAKRCLSLASN